MRAAASKRVFLADLESIERRLSEIERIDKQNALEKGMLLKHVRDNDLTHGQWLRWLDGVSIGERTAQRCIQAYEQFGNTTQASGLSVSALFDLIQLPPDINRAEFLGRMQCVPSTGEKKFVTEMSRKEIREIVRNARGEARLTKPAEKVREIPTSNVVGDVWSALDLTLSELSPTESEELKRLPLTLTRKVYELPDAIRSVVLGVSANLSIFRFSENFDEILTEARRGKDTTTIAQAYKKQPEPQPISGVFINPFEILGVRYGDSEETIKRKYRELMKKVHPDSGGSALFFKLTKAAYDEFSSGRHAMR